jgi:hypothetical protein
MTVGSSSATSLQALKLIAATGTLSVFSATVVQAVEGTVSLQNTDATDGVITGLWQKSERQLVMMAFFKQ